MRNPQMALRKWLNDNEVNQSELARRIGVHRYSVTLYLQARRRPSLDTAKDIAHETGNAVTPAMWGHEVAA